jgi:gamma-glutamyltranspeptidase/glutathione hydrolase
MVCAIDHLAAGSGVEMLRRGGSAADAAVAASAVLAFTSQHMCGMGGDLWAVVSRPGEDPVALDASGHAGAGADPERLRRRGLAEIPPGEPAAVTVPGCVDGWLALHGRFGRLALAEILEPARRYAAEGFPAAPQLAAGAAWAAAQPGGEDYRAPGGLRPGARVRRPGVARALQAIAADGRNGFYGGEFGTGLIALGAGEYAASDLERNQADWVTPVRAEAWGARLWSAPPSSQGYLTLAGAWIASGLELPDPADPGWAHLLIEACRQAAHDRLDVLHERADGVALLAAERLAPRRAAIDPRRASSAAVPASAGDTIGLCVVDAERMGISLLQSNAAGWGSGLVEPATRIFLHGRGRGFNLIDGHPAEYGAGRRPPHTLAPLVVTSAGGDLRAVLATMGGDSQPQVLLQLAARLLAADEQPHDAVAAGRFALAPPLDAAGRPDGDMFATWRERGRVSVMLEGNVAPAWAAGLRRRGHAVVLAPAFDSSFGHAHAIAVGEDALCGASDPRPRTGEAAGY